MTRIRIVYRSAITGLFVTKECAEANPDTTIEQRLKITARDKGIEAARKCADADVVKGAKK